MRLLLALLFLLQLTVAFGQDDDSEEREVAAFNAAVSDADIADFLALEVQYDPVDSAAWSALTPEARALKVGEIRRAHEKNHLRLSTLRGLSAKEFDSLRQTMQFRAMLMQSLRTARAVMPTLGPEQHQLIRDTCVLEMSGSNPRAPLRSRTPTPPALEFLHPDLVRIHRDRCEVFLHKGMGMGVGFRVHRADGAWRLFWFDEYEAWDEHEIALP